MTLEGDPGLIKNDFDCPPENPIELFTKWLKKAEDNNFFEPRGFVLSTLSEDSVSNRVVYLKDVTKSGFIFATSEHSNKGKDITRNNNVAGNFWWRESVKQISFTGRAEKLSKKSTEDIFYSRTKESQAISAASMQSEILQNEKSLKERFDFFLKQDCIKVPNSWHGYHIEVNKVEFWEGAKTRFHKRLKYELAGDKWNRCFLQP